MRQSGVVNDIAVTSQVDLAEDGWGRGKLVRLCSFSPVKNFLCICHLILKTTTEPVLISLDFVLHNISHISKVLKASLHTTDRQLQQKTQIRYYPLHT